MLKSSDGVTFFGSDNGTLFVSIVVIVLTSGLVALGMAGYARIQKICLWAGLIGFAIMVVLMVISSQADFKAAFDRVNESLFGVTGAYDKTIADAAANDAFTGSLAPLDFGANIGDTIMATLAMIPFMLFWILYPNWGSTLYGEVRGSGDFQKVLRGMLGGIWVTAVLALVFVLLAANTFGWLFFNATNVNFINNFYGYTTTAPTVPIWSYPPLIASYLIDNTIFQIGMVVLFGVWFLGWSGTLFLSSTRMIFAAAFDRVLPDGAAQVSERRAVPIMALLYIMIPAVILSVAYAYSPTVRGWTLDATLVIAVTFLGSAIAATILPWYKPRDLRQLGDREPEAARQRCRARHRGDPRLDDLPVAVGPALRHRGRQCRTRSSSSARSTASPRSCTSPPGSSGARRAWTSTRSIRRSRPNRAEVFVRSVPAPLVPEAPLGPVSLTPSQRSAGSREGADLCPSPTLVSLTASQRLGASAEARGAARLPVHAGCSSRGLRCGERRGISALRV